MRRRRRGAGARQSGVVGGGAERAQRDSRRRDRAGGISSGQAIDFYKHRTVIRYRYAQGLARTTSQTSRTANSSITFKPAELSTLYLNRLLTFSPRYCSARAPPAVRIPLRLCVALARSTILPSARRVARPSAAAAACSCGARRHSRSAASARAGGRCSPCRSAQAGGVCGGQEGVGAGGCRRRCGRGCRRGCGRGCRGRLAQLIVQRIRVQRAACSVSVRRAGCRAGLTSFSS